MDEHETELCLFFLNDHYKDLPGIVSPIGVKGND